VADTADEQSQRVIAQLTKRLDETSIAAHRTPQEQWTGLMTMAAALLPEIGQQRWTGEVMPAISARLRRWDDQPRQIPRTWHSAALLDANAPLVALCDALSIHGDDPRAPDHAALGALLASPHLSHIRDLNICDVLLAGDGIDALLGHRMGALRALTLDGCGIGDGEIARMVAHAPLWSGLRYVALPHNRLREASAQALADCPHLAGLETLDLTKNPLGKAGRIALGLSPHLSQRAKISAHAIAAPAPVEPVSAADAREVFGDVRSILQQAPSAHGWALLCDRIDRMDPERANHEAIPYALRGLDGWPDTLRVSPNVWTDSIAAGALPAGAELTRALTLDGKALNTQRAANLARWAEQAPIARLRIQGGSVSYKALMALLNNASWPALRALECDCELPPATFTALKIGAQHLAIEALSLRGVPSEYASASVEEVTALAKSPIVRGLRTLRLGISAQRSEPLVALRDAPWWWQLEELELRAYVLQPEQQRALLGRGEDPGWERLHTLKLGNFPATNTRAVEFADIAQRMPALRTLGIHLLPVEPIWRILNAPWPALDTVVLERIPSDDPASIKGFTGWELPTLRHLDLQFTSFGDIRTSHGAPHAILSSPAASALETLVLRGGYMDDARLPIVCAHLPATLTALTIAQNDLGPEGARSLATRPLPALRSLSLHNISSPREGMDALYAASWWPQLEHLALHSAREVRSLETMAGRLPPGLKTLSLHGSLQSEELLLALLKGGLPATLESLTLSQCSMSSKGLKALCDQLPALPRLHTLDLRDNTMNHKAILPLLSSPQLAQLAILELDGNRLGFQGKKLIMDSPTVPLYTKGAI
jgi:hypothetical protein